MADKLPFFASEWEACDPEGFAARADRPETVLETISRVRLADVQAAAAVMPLEELKAKVEAEAGPAIDFYERLSRVDGMAVLAEIKRASPSKAWIDPDCIAAEQGERYAKAGAAAISVRRCRLGRPAHLYATGPEWLCWRRCCASRIGSKARSMTSRPCGRRSRAWVQNALHCCARTFYSTSTSSGKRDSTAQIPFC